MNDDITTAPNPDDHSISKTAEREEPDVDTASYTSDVFYDSTQHIPQILPVGVSLTPCRFCEICVMEARRGHSTQSNPNDDEYENSHNGDVELESSDSYILSSTTRQNSEVTTHERTVARIVGIVTAVFLLAAFILVAVTLSMSSHIDDMVKQRQGTTPSSPSGPVNSSNSSSV